jgi:hypothetical protein
MPAKKDPARSGPCNLRRAAEKLLAQFEALQAKSYSPDLDSPIAEVKKLLRRLSAVGR